MPATVASASAVESATAAMESAPTMEAIPAAEPTAAVERVRTMYTTAVAASITVGIRATTVAVSRTSIKAAAVISAIPEPARMTPVIPRARADKRAAYKPVRTVIAVGRASIRIIVVVPIVADRRTSRVSGTDPNSHRPNPDSYANLRLRIRQRHHQDRQQRQIFRVTHIRTPGSGPSFLLVPEAFSEAGSLAVHLTIASTYWNAAGVEKLLKTGWLISAMSAKINHLQRIG